MIGFHEAMAYCENITVGLLTFLAGALAIYVGSPVVAVILCGFLLTAQTLFKLVTENRGWEVLLACVFIMVLSYSGAVKVGAYAMTLMQLASVYDGWCHRKLNLSKHGVFENGAAMEAEACRDIGMGGRIPSSGGFPLRSMGH